MPLYTFRVGASVTTSEYAARGIQDGDIIIVTKNATPQPDSNPSAEFMVFDTQHSADADAVAAALSADPDALDAPDAALAASIANAKTPSITVSKSSLRFYSTAWRSLLDDPARANPPPPRPNASDPRVGLIVEGHLPISFQNGVPLFANIANATVTKRADDGSDSYEITDPVHGVFHLNGASIDFYKKVVAPLPQPVRDIITFPSTIPSQQLVIQQLAPLKLAAYSSALSDPTTFDRVEAQEMLRTVCPIYAHQPPPSDVVLVAVLSSLAPLISSLPTPNLPPGSSIQAIVAAMGLAITAVPGAAPAGGAAPPPQPRGLDAPPPQPLPAPVLPAGILPAANPVIQFGDSTWHQRYPLVSQLAGSAESQQQWDAALTDSCAITDPDRATFVAGSEYTALGAMNRYFNKLRTTRQQLETIIDRERAAGSQLLSKDKLINVLLECGMQQPTGTHYRPPPPSSLSSSLGSYEVTSLRLLLHACMHGLAMRLSLRPVASAIVPPATGCFLIFNRALALTIASARLLRS
jgi:hypothetical protein